MGRVCKRTKFVKEGSAVGTSYCAVRHGVPPPPPHCSRGPFVIASPSRARVGRLGRHAGDALRMASSLPFVVCSSPCATHYGNEGWAPRWLGCPWPPSIPSSEWHRIRRGAAFHVVVIGAVIVRGSPLFSCNYALLLRAEPPSATKRHPSLGLAFSHVCA